MVYTLGEMLLDVLTERKITYEEFLSYGHPGGAMLNTAVSLARSGIKTALISETGSDTVADLLIRFLKENKIETKYIVRYPSLPASVALARLNKQKKAHYTFLKNYPEKRRLLLPARFKPPDVLLFGSLYALDPTIRKAVLTALSKAKKADSIIVYDPNIRQTESLKNPLWEKALWENLSTATIIKGSDEDFDAIFGKQPPEKHLYTLQEINPYALIFITLGDKGAIACHHKKQIFRKAEETEVVSTIGAGDGFNAGIIAEIVQSEISPFTLPDYMEKLLESGIKYSAAVCRSKDNYIPPFHL